MKEGKGWEKGNWKKEKGKRGKGKGKGKEKEKEKGSHLLLSIIGCVCMGVHVRMHPQALLVFFIA